MENRPPRDVLPRAELASRRVKPPLYYYGCPFTFKYALDYCKRHLLEIELAEEDMQYFGGKAVFNLADVDETHLSNPDLRVFLFTTAAFMMIKDLSAKCGMPLLCGRPFSQEWDGIVALWSNYDIKDRILMCSHFQTVVDTLSAGMNEEGHVSKPQWWFDWDNDVVSVTSPPSCNRATH